MKNKKEIAEIWFKILFDHYAWRLGEGEDLLEAKVDVSYNCQQKFFQLIGRIVLRSGHPDLARTMRRTFQHVAIKTKLGDACSGREKFLVYYRIPLGDIRLLKEVGHVI